MNRRRIVLLVVALAIVAAAAIASAIAFADGNETDAGPGAIQARAIAMASGVGVRAELLARRVGGGPAPTAQVVVTTFRRERGRWQRVASHRLGGTYFWHTVTAPHAVCRLELSTAGRGRTSSRLTVQLLVTPSIGCGKTQTVPLPG